MTQNPIFGRLALITGHEAMAVLENSRVIVIGLGGVGSWCAEALVRSGIGKISLVDSDRIHASNVNRQVQAVNSTIGMLKTAALEKRLKDINPSCEITSFPMVFSKETAAHFDIPGADYVIDAIDTLTCKLDLIETVLAAGKTLFSSMGMARKLDPLSSELWIFGKQEAALWPGSCARDCGSGALTVISPLCTAPNVCLCVLLRRKMILCRKMNPCPAGTRNQVRVLQPEPI